MCKSAYTFENTYDCVRDYFCAILVGEFFVSPFLSVLIVCFYRGTALCKILVYFCEKTWFRIRGTCAPSALLEFGFFVALRCMRLCLHVASDRFYIFGSNIVAQFSTHQKLSRKLRTFLLTSVLLAPRLILVTRNAIYVKGRA